MEKTVRVLVADDEYQSRLVIVKLLSRYFPDLPVATEAGTVGETVTRIQEMQPHLVFLDVRMQHETGFDVLDRIPHIDFEVIFTTAYTEYAIKAIRYSALDYLVKPVDPTAFQSAMQRALAKINQRAASLSERNILLQQQGATGNTDKKFTNKIAVPTADGLLFVNAQDIIYCQGQGNYTELYMTNGPVITSSHTLKTYEDMLAGHHFFRVHRSYLINLDHIKLYRRGEGGVAVMSNGDEVEVARRSKPDFLNLFKG
jgi:two-component system LytT family response regulator